MLPTAREGASYFLSRDRQTVRGMVTETLETPDEVTPHTSKNGFKEDVPHTSRSPWHIRLFLRRDRENYPSPS